MSLLLVDASIYVFRAWFSKPRRWHDHQGCPTNAVLGFVQSLLTMLHERSPSAVAVAFDERLSHCFRNDIFPEYKANRERADPDLIAQFQWCKSFVRALGIPALADPRYEADDLIGSLVHQWRGARRDGDVWIASRDKDLAQLLIDDRVRMWDIGDGKTWHTGNFGTRFGVPAYAFVEYQALVGDAVDNVPGVPGIGPTTARKLIARFGTLENLYRRLPQLHAEPRGVRRVVAVLQALESHRERVFAMREILRIRIDLQAVPCVSALTWTDYNTPAFDELAEQCGIAGALSGWQSQLADQRRSAAARRGQHE